MNVSLAFADILLLWVLILATLVAFWRVRVLAAVLLIPYLLVGELRVRIELRRLAAQSPELGVGENSRTPSQSAVRDRS